MDQAFKTFADTGLTKAKAMGVNEVEFYVVKNKMMALEVQEGSLQETKVAASQGIGVRVIKNQRLGFSFSSDFSPIALEKMLRQAVINAKYNDPDATLGFAKKQQEGYSVDVYDESLSQRPLEEKIQLARDTEQAALAGGKQITRVERAGYEEGESEIWIANSNGVLRTQKGSYCGVYALALGSDGQVHESGYGMDMAIRFTQVSAQKAGELAAKRAVRLLGAKSIKTQTAQVVLEPFMAIQIMGIIAASFSGEAMLKGRSMFCAKQGEQIASEFVTVVDDGTMAEKLGTAIFDGEGVNCSRTILVENGQLKNLLYNHDTAQKAGTVSTGNGMRGTYKGTPSIATTNYYVAPGKISEGELIGQVDKGLYVTEILGAHTANAISGEFSLGAAGIWIENGQFLGPVRGVTIAGNFKELLLQIDAVADNLTFYGASGAPTLRIGQMAIGGE